MDYNLIKNQLVANTFFSLYLFKFLHALEQQVPSIFFAQNKSLHISHSFWYSI